MAREERDLDGLTDGALRSRVVRERNRVAAATVAEREIAATSLNALRDEMHVVAEERDSWKARAEAAETENRALVQTRLFRWSASARLFWARIR